MQLMKTISVLAGSLVLAATLAVSAFETKLGARPPKGLPTPAPLQQITCQDTLDAEPALVPMFVPQALRVEFTILDEHGCKLVFHGAATAAVKETFLVVVSASGTGKLIIEEMIDEVVGDVKLELDEGGWVRFVHAPPDNWYGMGSNRELTCITPGCGE